MNTSRYRALLLNCSKFNLSSHKTISTTCQLHKKVNPSLPNLATPEEATRKTAIKRKFFWRMFDYVESYSDKVLSKLLPEVAFKALKTFSRGTKGLFGDMKVYTRVNNILSATSDWEKACRTLNRKELEVNFYQSF